MKSNAAVAETYISPAEVERISRRHADIPQDALPVEDVERIEPTKASKSKSPRSVKWKKCPRHTPSGKKQLTGLVMVDGETLVFRDHTKTIGRHTVPCPGSGLEWVEDEGDH